MSADIIIQYLVFLIVLVIFSIPLGTYMAKVMNGEHVFLSKILSPIENLIYKIIGVKKDEEMTWKTYLSSVIWFFFIGLGFLYIFQCFQDKLPFNPQNIDAMSWHLSFNTAASFATNTNWQAYSGEAQLSYFSQFMGLTTQNFVSAATGIAVLFALIRAFVRAKSKTIGNFWVDLTRSIIYILLPLSVVVTMALASQGVVQNLSPGQEVQLVEPIAVDSEGNIIENATIDRNNNVVFVDGEKVEDATIVTKQFVPMGPGASQIAIKQLGTNGGGFFGVNSAHPLENPNSLTNMIECTALLLIPAGLCFTFGRNIRDKKQGIAIFTAMYIMLIAFLSVIAINEQNGTPQLAQNGEGCSTTRLVEVADQIIKDAKIIYQNVWIVFDKDDFDDFDQAIQEAINRGYNVAWSNQSFEYWLYLHFYYSDSALHRHQWNAKLDEIFKKNNLGDGTYQKNYDDIYSLVDIYGGVTVAIKHAKRRMAEFERGGYKPSEYDPGTMVYKLVESLKVYLE